MTATRKWVYGTQARYFRADRKREYVKQGDPHPFVLIVEQGEDQYVEFDATSIGHAQALAKGAVGRTAAIWFVEQNGALAGEYVARTQQPFGGGVISL